MTSDDTVSVRVVSAFEGKRLEPLRQWWLGLEAAGTLPTRSHFKLADWKAHLPWIAVADVIRARSGEIADGLIRVWGTGLTAPFGGDATGQKLSDFGEPYVQRWMTPALLVEETRKPVAVQGRVLLPGKDFQRFEGLFLPLFDAQPRFERLLSEFELVKSP